jgi:hypothetical protein
MDILKMLSELREERDRLSEAILTIERLAAGSHQKRRGRPPKWMAAIKAGAAPEARQGPRRPFSAETRKKMAAAQRKRWAARKGNANA